MKKQIALVTLAIVALVVPVFVHAELALLTKTLKAGMRDKEILSLQSILNRNPATLVTQSGAGSKGNETEYFGKGTLEAVKKFQKLNASKILVPAGLTEPTGIVGSLTRTVINSYISGGDTAGGGSPQSDDFLFLPPTEEEATMTEAEAEAKYQLALKRFGEVRLAQETRLAETRKQIEAGDVKRQESIRVAEAALDQYEETVTALKSLQNGMVEGDALEFKVAIPATPFPGTTVMLFGSKLKGSTVMHIGAQSVKINVGDESGLTASVVIPADMKAGTYEMYLTDGNATTPKRHITILEQTLSDKTPSVPKVAISSVSVNRQSGAVAVTLKGYGYTNNNSILTPFKTYDNVRSSDGNSLTFVLDQSLFSGAAITETSFPVIVMNENGLSSMTTVEVK